MPDGPSRYTYVANSPLMCIDPTGLQEIHLNFTRHGAARANGSRGRYYPSLAILDAIENPLSISPGKNGAIVYKGVG